MSAVNPVSLISVEEYLEGEKSSPIRHEYIDGRVFAMSGVSLRHNLLTNKLSRRLFEKLDGTNCATFTTEVKVAANPTIYYYSDIAVTCSPIRQDEYICPDPILLIEIISPSTEQIDRREKARSYKEIESLREYVIVEQVRQAVELHRRSNTGEWEILQFSQGDQIYLVSIDLTLSLEDLYSGIQFTVEN
jgi:Uma2 family endonuclease